MPVTQACNWLTMMDERRMGARLEMERKMELEVESRSSGTGVGKICDSKLPGFPPAQASKPARS